MRCFYVSSSLLRCRGCLSWIQKLHWNKQQFWWCNKILLNISSAYCLYHHYTCFLSHVQLLVNNWSMEMFFHIYILHCCWYGRPPSPQRKLPRRWGRLCAGTGLSVPPPLATWVIFVCAVWWSFLGSDGGLTRSSGFQWRLRSSSHATMSENTNSTFSSGSPAVRPCHIPG